MGTRKSFKRTFVERVRTVADRLPRVDGSDSFYPPLKEGTDEWRRAQEAVTMPWDEARAILRDAYRDVMGRPHRKLLRDGMPPRIEVEMALKGMHDGRRNHVRLHLDAIDFYLITGRDPYTGWGISVRWR